MPRRYVIDAGVAAKLFVDEPLSDKADALFSLLTRESQPAFHVPDMFYAEVIGALRKHALRFGYPHIREDTAALLALALLVTPTANLALDAVGISLQHGISTYDALYVALTRRVDGALVTADERLARAMLGTGYNVQSLAEFSVSDE
jgi:predicted nucleic acid-binding protein